MTGPIEKITGRFLLRTIYIIPLTYALWIAFSCPCFDLLSCHLTPFSAALIFVLFVAFIDNRGTLLTY